MNCLFAFSQTTKFSAFFFMETKHRSLDIDQKDLKHKKSYCTYLSLCSYRLKMDENGAHESHMDFYAQSDTLKVFVFVFL